MLSSATLLLPTERDDMIIETYKMLRVIIKSPDAMIMNS